MAKHTTIEISARDFEDYDDCLAAAAAQYVEDHPEAEGYDLNPRWVGGDEGGREYIALDVPATRVAKTFRELSQMSDSSLVSDDELQRAIDAAYAEGTITADEVADLEHRLEAAQEDRG